MNTLVLRINDADAAGDYPVRLYAADLDAGEALPQRPTVSGKVRGSLALPNAVIDPVTKRPLTFEAVRDAYDEDALFPTAVDAPAQNQAAKQLVAMGAFLFRILFRDRIEAAWRKQFKRPGVRRVYIDVVPPALRAAPWELLFDPLLSRFLFTNSDCPVLRGWPAPAVPVCDWPIRALIVIAARETQAPGDGGLTLAREEDALRRAFEGMRQSVEVESCVRPSRAQLQQAIREVRPHVLHFMGHGREADPVTGEAALHVHGPAEWDWAVPEIQADLAGGDLTFAFLNACHTANAAVRDGVAAVADALLNVGARAVVGMQRAVANEAAASMAATFYGALRDERPIRPGACGSVRRARHPKNAEQPRPARYAGARGCMSRWTTRVS